MSIALLKTVNLMEHGPFCTNIHTYHPWRQQSLVQGDGGLTGIKAVPSAFSFLGLPHMWILMWSFSIFKCSSFGSYFWKHHEVRKDTVVCHTWLARHWSVICFVTSSVIEPEWCYYTLLFVCFSYRVRSSLRARLCITSPRLSTIMVMGHIRC